MKVIKSKNYKFKEIIKNSEYNPDEFHTKIQNITKAVHQGKDIYESIKAEFYNFSTEQIEQVKDYVLQALGKPVPTSDPAAYSAF